MITHVGGVRAGCCSAVLPRFTARHGPVPIQRYVALMQDRLLSIHDTCIVCPLCMHTLPLALLHPTQITPTCLLRRLLLQESLFADEARQADAKSTAR